MTDDKLEARKFFERGPLQAATALQNKLPIDEMNYLQVLGSAWGAPRAHFLYGVLDEAIKAGTACIRWNEFLEPKPNEIPVDQGDTQRDHIDRLVIEAVIDEQNMWMRKLIEALIDLILFGQTNEEACYSTYLAAKYLDAYLRLQGDFKEFYACESGNVAHSIASLKEDIRQSWPENVPRLWFLQACREEFFNQSYQLHPGRFLRSAHSKFQDAVKLGSAEERLILGMSYDHAFGGSSRSIHFNIGGPMYSADLDGVKRNVGHVGLLSLHLVNRAYHLSGIKPEGVAQQVRELFSGGSVAPSLMAQVLESRVDPGDLVLVYGQLAEVLEETVSEYDYRAYRIRYLSRPPLPEMPEEWVPSRYVHHMIRRRDAKKYFERGLSKTSEGKKVWEILKNLPDDKLFDAVRGTLDDLKQRGLLVSLWESGQ